MSEPILAAVSWNDAWADAHDTVAPTDLDEKHKPTVMKTVGWILRDDEAGISLFNERCLDAGDTSYRSRTFIPRMMVISVEPVVKPRKPRKPKRKDQPDET